MRLLFCTCLVAAAMAIAPASNLRAQANYDGTYVGVSGTTNGGSAGGKCPPMQTPAAMTIAGGAAHSSGEAAFTGNVAANGHVVLHTASGIRYEGQIDGAGNLSVTGATTRCSFTFAWRKGH